MKLYTKKGYTLVEMLIVLMLIGIALGTAFYNLKSIDNPVRNAANEIESYLILARGKSITNTAYTVITPTTNGLTGVYGSSCTDAAAVPDSQLTYTLPRNVTFTDTTWRACISPRGLYNSNSNIVVRDNTGRTATLEIFIGGAIKTTYN